MKTLSLLLALSLLLLPGRGRAQALGAGTGFFVYDGYAPLRDKPVRVYYHIPAGDASKMPVLLALHGEERDGQAYAADWVEAADQYGFMVIAPEFPDSLYSGGDGYNLAGMFVDGDNPSPATLRPDSLWAFALLDPLFAEVKRRTGTQAGSYVAFAHSAGAQMLQRFVLYAPQSRMRKAICANAGWYNMPDTAAAFPYGTQLVPWPQETRREAFARDMLILLGQQDNNPNSASLRHTAEADRQGLNRLARGRYFFAQSKATAAAANLPFGWTLAEVAGVSHDHTRMAKNAISYVVAAFDTSAPAAPLAELVIGTGTEGIRLSGLADGEAYTMTVYTADGRRFLQGSGTGPGPALLPYRLNVPAVYLVEVVSARHARKTQKVSFQLGD